MSFPEVFEMASSPVTESPPSPTEPVHSFWGSVMIRGAQNQPLFVYLGKSNFESGDRLISTTSASEIDYQSILLHQEHIPGLRNIDLRYLNIKEFIPVSVNLAGIKCEQTFYLDRPPVDTVKIRYQLPLRINDHVYPEKECSTQLDLPKFLEIFDPDSPSALIFLKEIGAEEGQLGLLFVLPERPHTAVGIFFEDHESMPPSSGRNIDNLAAANSALYEFISEICRLYPGKFNFILEAIESRSDYRQAERAVLQQLMKLQAISDYYYVITTQHNSKIMAPFKSGYRYSAILNSPKYSIEKVKERIMSRADETESYVHDEVSFAIQPKPTENDELKILTDLDNFISSVDTSSQSELVIEWLREMYELGKRSVNPLIKRKVVEKLELYSDKGSKRDEKTIKHYTSRKKLTAKQPVSELTKEASIAIRIDMLNRGYLKAWKEADFNMIDLAFIPAQEEVDQTVVYKWIRTLYDLANYNPSIVEPALQRFNTYLTEGLQSTIKLSHTYNGRKLEKAQPANLIITNCIINLRKKHYPVPHNYES